MNMQALIEDFPSNLLEAIEIAEGADLSRSVGNYTNVVICGMGGSGIGGTIVSTWVSDELRVPVEIVKDYTIPSYVNTSTLVIGSSYSGNTEETLSCIEQAHDKGATIVGICSGGDLAAFCEKNNFDCVIVPGGNPPRTALAFSLVQLLNIFHKTALIPHAKLSEIKGAHELITTREKEIKAEANKLANHLLGKVAVFYGGGRYEGVVVRARQQFNENSKLLCWHHILPEMNHNELVGWYGGDDRFAVVFFESDDMHPRNAVRMKITRDKILEKTKQVMTLHPKGETLIEKSIYFINLVDWSSLFLADLKEADAMDIAVIDFLKSELAKL